MFVYKSLVVRRVSLVLLAVLVSLFAGGELWAHESVVSHTHNGWLFEKYAELFKLHGWLVWPGTFVAAILVWLGYRKYSSSEDEVADEE